MDISYLPGREEITGGPLARFLPPLPLGVFRDWLSDKLPPGAWLLDPFGVSPQADIEAAAAGYCVLTAVNNPITRFILDVLAAAPRPADFQPVIAALADSRWGSERFEPRLQSMYETECPSCGKKIEVRGYLWERGAKTPYARALTCPYCKDEGEHAITAHDLNLLAALPPDGLYRSRAMEKIAVSGDPIREDVEQALECYLPRPLYILFTLINKLEGLNLQPQQRVLLTALLISACDAADSLWPHPSSRTRPHALATASHFIETNLWQVIQSAVEDWTVNTQAVHVTEWPNLPDEGGGICIFQGRSRELASSLDSMHIRALIGVLPRPNQAFWTLSALWSGWLWGREAAAPLRGALSRRRYDWSWHTSALQSSLAGLLDHIPAGTQFFSLMTEAEPAFFSAAALGLSLAGFNYEGAALRADQTLAQITTRSGPPSRPTVNTDPEQSMRETVKRYLIRRSEPTPYFDVHSAAVTAWITSGGYPAGVSHNGAEGFAHLQAALHGLFSDRELFTRYSASEHALESGQWWIANQPCSEQPLSDWIEMDLVRYLQSNPGCTFAEIDYALCAINKGLYTPPLSLVQAAAESYADFMEPDRKRLRLRVQDSPVTRRADLLDATALLKQVGAKLGMLVEGELPILWKNNAGMLEYVFYPIASSLISRFVFTSLYPPEICLIVLPGSRSNLVTYKLRENPLLANAVGQGWRLLKFRHLRALADNPLLNRESWALQLENDPPEYKPAQLNMF